MRPVKGFRAGLAEGGLVDGKRVAAADESVILCNDRMIPLKTITFGGDVQKGVDHDETSSRSRPRALPRFPRASPERRSRRYSRRSSGPVCGQRAMHCEHPMQLSEVIDRFCLWRQDGRPHGAYLGTETAPGASSSLREWDVHPRASAASARARPTPWRCSLSRRRMRIPYAP